MIKTFYAVDADLRPVWLEALTADAAGVLLDLGEAHSLMSAARYKLVWATRHGETRWFVFPR